MAGVGVGWGGTAERLHSLITDIAGVDGRSWVVVVQW